VEPRNFSMQDAVAIMTGAMTGEKVPTNAPTPSPAA
jgi:hypothetical protein